MGGEPQESNQHRTSSETSYQKEMGEDYQTVIKRNQRSKVSKDIPRGQEPPTLFFFRGLPRFLNHPTRADGNAEKQEWQDATREQDRALD